MNTNHTEEQTHTFGDHGAIGLETKNGRICAECQQPIEDTPPVEEPVLPMVHSPHAVNALPPVDIAEDIKTQISKILIKWSMPTRQAAINEIVALHDSLRADQIQKIEGLRTKDIMDSYWSESTTQNLWAEGYIKAIDDVLAILKGEA